ncbi:hypothetical protein BV25DRAFT_1172490 [Artomyces pyxidatus]|uniref:Uncharacterized protein n=1 Tax=Artomyces pyxidatus TaxID=48021 RepID=A0ACB8ST99_9AGAM|nr:hypothetical protein BV25DRAFT_1172490 [Artomyces pyxidatus]
MIVLFFQLASYSLLLSNLCFLRYPVTSRYRWLSSILSSIATQIVVDPGRHACYDIGRLSLLHSHTPRIMFLTLSLILHRHVHVALLHALWNLSTLTELRRSTLVAHPSRLSRLELTRQLESR